MATERDPRSPTLDAETEPAGKKAPADYHSAEALIDEATQNAELSPAVKAALAPFQWYVNRLKQDIEALKAPFQWLESFREKVEAQAQKDGAWQRLIQTAELRPFDVGTDGSRVWVTRKPWAPGSGWVLVADDAAWREQEHGLRVWSNPSLRALATEHAHGPTFVERAGTPAVFIQKLDALKTPGREREGGR